MLFVTVCLLLGLGILLWCAAVSAGQILKRYQDTGSPWESATRHVEEADHCAEPTHQRQEAA